MIQNPILPTTAVRPFRIDVPQAELDDLRARLAGTRWPDEAHGPAWGMGTDRAYLQDLLRAWQTDDDWRRHEAALNELPQFMADVDGRAVHFVHVHLVGAADCLIGVGCMAEDASARTLPRIEIRGAEPRDVRRGWRFQVHVFTEQGGQDLTWAGRSYERAIFSAEVLATRTGRQIPVVDLVGA